jgi:hypothetical protein
MRQTPSMSQAWIYLLKLWKKQFQYAGKSIIWKDVFPQSWEVLLPDLPDLPGPQQPLHSQGVTFRRQPGPSLRPRLGPVGRD